MLNGEHEIFPFRNIFFFLFLLWRRIIGSGGNLKRLPDPAAEEAYVRSLERGAPAKQYEWVIHHLASAYV